MYLCTNTQLSQEHRFSTFKVGSGHSLWRCYRVYVCKTCSETRPEEHYYTAINKGRRYRHLSCVFCVRENADKYSKTAVARRRGKAIARLDPEGMSGEERFRYWDAFKKARGCVECGSRDRLEFDHLPESVKRFTISAAVRRTGLYTDEEIEIEVSKCEIVCRSCHQSRTTSRLRYPTTYVWSE